MDFSNLLFNYRTICDVNDYTAPTYLIFQNFNNEKYKCHDIHREIYSQVCETPKMECFAKTVSRFQTLSNFEKCSILEV